LKSLRIGLSNINVVVSAGYLVLQAKDEMDKRYFKYLLHRYDVAYMKLLGSGVRQTISFNHIANSLLVAPPLAEQRAIASFLDDKCAKIDEAVKIKEDQITLLRERRQIIIQDAVTRGLNPTAPMKDSGIDWIGKIPAHWEVKRVKHVAVISPSKSLDGVVRNNDQAVFLPMEAISETGAINQNARMAVKDAFDGFTYFQRNDVVIAKITPCFENGKGAFLGNLETTHGFGTTELHVFRPRKISGVFLYLLLNRLAFRKHAEEFMTGSAGQKRVPTPFMANYQFALPSEFEQGEIIEFCEAQSKAIKNLISIKENQITSLKEYRTSLINAAVTGKIKVV
jgi:type I restriction enzyme S subunit